MYGTVAPSPQQKEKKKKDRNVFFLIFKLNIKRQNEPFFN